MPASLSWCSSAGPIPRPGIRPRRRRSRLHRPGWGRHMARPAAEAPLAPPVNPCRTENRTRAIVGQCDHLSATRRRFRHGAAGKQVVLEWIDARCRALASLFLLLASCWPGSHRPSAQAPVTQLDRIEQKLDTILHRLDQMQPGQSSAASRPLQPPPPAFPLRRTR